MSKRGNATVEMAIIFPIIIYVIFILIHLVIIMYQKAYVKSLCNVILTEAAKEFYKSDILKTDNIYVTLYDKKQDDKLSEIKSEIKQKINKDGLIKPTNINQKINVRNLLLYKELESEIIVEYRSPVAVILKLVGLSDTYKIKVINTNLIKNHKNYINNIDYAFEIYNHNKGKLKMLDTIDKSIKEIKKRLIY